MVQMEKSFLCIKLSRELVRQYSYCTFLSHIKKRTGNFKICVDKGFLRSGSAFNILVGPYNNHTAQQLYPHLCEYLLCISNVYTSLTQASKWGMHGMQGSFPMQETPSKQLLQKTSSIGMNYINSQFLYWIGCVKSNSICIWSRIWMICQPQWIWQSLPILFGSWGLQQWQWQ